MHSGDMRIKTGVCSRNHSVFLFDLLSFFSEVAFSNLFSSQVSEPTTSLQMNTVSGKRESLVKFYQVI